MGQWFVWAQLGRSGGGWAVGLLNPLEQKQLTSALLGSHPPTHQPEIADLMVGGIPGKADLLRASRGPAPS